MRSLDPCDKCKAITRGGKAVYYICRNRESTHFNSGVSIVTHEACHRKRWPSPPKPEPEAPLPEMPGIVRRVVSYAEALATWVAAGKPQRSDKDVEAVFHQFCKTCGWYDPDKQVCRGCGCRVAESGFAILNKIKMATEHCPQERW